MLRASLAKPSRPVLRRCMTSLASKKEGDISDAFTSLSGAQREPLPDRYRQLKLNLLQGRQDKIVQSWKKLLRELKRENEIVAKKGPGVIPQIDFKDLEKSSDGLREEVKKRGVVVVRGVIPEGEARAYKAEVEEYVAKNPSTRAFPPHDPQVYELYWSPPQLKARSHPNFLTVQHNLMSLWHTTSPTSISLSQPFSYADRLRIRQPGDASFALGPHIDGGSVERWEPEGYGAGHVYDAILQGTWDSYDPWDASGRVDAVNNRYDGLGACSMFRMWQGWMSMSHTKPGEGTLLVNPLVKLSMAYVLLRPFFKAKSERLGQGYLDEGNWELMRDVDSELQGATPGTGQELTGELHPHLELERTMVHVPEIQPGDFVAWHCDTIHSVDKVHAGTSDSSVLYIPICPITTQNAEYMVRQRDAFLRGTPGPDFPGGAGESGHVGRGTEKMLDGAARRAMGLSALRTEGENDVVAEANRILGF
ncbi:hypothetical protein NOF04DRAFT_3579 [Fusarium oxysporum II5]|uniref:DUF1479 domain protein n=3 Tax=Fusarium oxysporum species complex TaxID=171631 RepID=N1S763_FUSC4|nr:uncharacterized protein FOIG_07561 [Fusarium odoratissimum NRRL 54006]EMT73401.1 Putative protein ybiU [Fusarium odoratissimum]EXM00580.1 hypothetical protein FOIG_07561 [Fusarium odoratissimum NRRL 54006]KAK2127472.1 hypothetical protein NOF04DRAFT_3579 [Fusarium oxysporum II5]TXB98803.1 hypothetical protein FocTR4_00013376 [Fusarium oxysporum f. sp. cubense]